MAIFWILLLLTPAAIAAQALGASAVVTFTLAAIAIVPLAKLIGDATEELSARTGPALGGLLNATFGNATELIIGVLAVRAGLIDVVKASLTGSILGNLLFVLGTAMIAGGIKNKKLTFNRTAAAAAGSTLFVAAIALIIPALFVWSAPQAPATTVADLNVTVAVVMIVAYIAMLWFSNYTHRYLYEEKKVGVEEKAEAGWSIAKSFWVLIAATVAVAWVSTVLVGSIEPFALALGWTNLFIGVIFIAIIGNVAEHVSAIMFALKNKMDLALQVAIGSATQIIMFVAPFLVLVSLVFPYHMDLLFVSFELFAMVLAIILVNLIVADGESNWLEGVQLLMTYVIMAIAFYLHL
ncbi:MAG TPA: calcium/proton exchanger [Candidatus Paceibacterota bacterium]|jgi:Ca2+:H+ antiporter|nr:calcium/proton exchanger [Candidatus Paceibacterota bacterium]